MRGGTGASVAWRDGRGAFAPSPPLLRFTPAFLHPFFVECFYVLRAHKGALQPTRADGPPGRPSADRLDGPPGLLYRWMRRRLLHLAELTAREPRPTDSVATTDSVAVRYPSPLSAPLSPRVANGPSLNMPESVLGIVWSASGYGATRAQAADSKSGFSLHHHHYMSSGKSSAPGSIPS